MTTQINAAGALLAILTAHPALPTPLVEVRELWQPDGPPEWGLRIALHSSLSDFERWRAALGIDTADIDHRASPGRELTWLIVTARLYGVPVELIGFHDTNEPDEPGR